MLFTEQCFIKRLQGDEALSTIPREEGLLGGSRRVFIQA